MSSPPSHRVPAWPVNPSWPRRFGVGRAAARSALQELERRLLVRRVQGAGTFVNRRIDYVISRTRPPSWHATVDRGGRGAAGRRPRTWSGSSLDVERRRSARAPGGHADVPDHPALLHRRSAGVVDQGTDSGRGGARSRRRAAQRRIGRHGAAPAGWGPSRAGVVPGQPRHPTDRRCCGSCGSRRACRSGASTASTATPRPVRCCSAAAHGRGPTRSGWWWSWRTSRGNGEGDD